MKLIPIIIPFFRETQKLNRCVEAILNQSYAPVDIFIRDNTHDNILFTAAVNEGLKKFCFDPEIDYVLVLNQDAYLFHDALENLVAFMDNNPQCGIAGPLQINSDNNVMWGGSLQAFPYGSHTGGDISQFINPTETYWANGACMLLRTEMIREIGILDKNMKFICSDADYSFTARSRGWQVFMTPHARVEHSPDYTYRNDMATWLTRIQGEDIFYFISKWINGGLYKAISYEGIHITPEMVTLKIKEIENTLQALI